MTSSVRVHYNNAQLSINESPEWTFIVIYKRFATVSLVYGIYSTMIRDCVFNLYGSS